MLARQKTYQCLVRNAIAQPALEMLVDVCDVAVVEQGGKMPNPNVLFLRNDKISTDDYPDLIALGRAGTGVDNIDNNDLTKVSNRGIPIFYAPGANANSVAELAFMLMYGCARNVFEARNFVQQIDVKLGNEAIDKLVDKSKKQFRGFELMGKTLGVVGMGNIGRIVAKRAIHTGMHVIAFDPMIQDDVWERDFDPSIMRASSIKRLMRGSDVVSVHVNLNDQTRHLIGAEEIAEVKRGAILLNLAREPICDEDVIISALDGKRLHAFISDFPTERLITHPKAVTMPHLGASTGEAEERAGIMAAKALVDYLQFGVVANSINFPTLEARPRAGIRMRLAIPHRNVPGIIGLVGDAIRDAGGNIGPFHSDTKNGLGYCVADMENTITLENVTRFIKSKPDILGVRTFAF